MTAGPLTRDPPPPLSVATAEELAEWVAYVGLGGRYALVSAGFGVWYRWDGRRWVRAHRLDVNAAIRRAVESAELTDDHLLDVNRRLGPLLTALRRVVTVPRERVGL